MFLIFDVSGVPAFLNFLNFCILSVSAFSCVWCFDVLHFLMMSISVFLDIVNYWFQDVFKISTLLVIRGFSDFRHFDKFCNFSIPVTFVLGGKPRFLRFSWNFGFGGIAEITKILEKLEIRKPHHHQTWNRKTQNPRQRKHAQPTKLKIKQRKTQFYKQTESGNHSVGTKRKTKKGKNKN